MNYNFEYIDIILLAMIAGFIVLRLRAILGRKTGHEENSEPSFVRSFSTKKFEKETDLKSFDDNAKNDFLKGAKIAYESVITNFANGNLKDIKSVKAKHVINLIFLEFFLLIGLNMNSLDRFWCHSLDSSKCTYYH